MAIVPKGILTGAFENGKRPDEEDFENLIDSCYGTVKGIAVSSDLRSLAILEVDEETGQIKETPIPRDPQSEPITYDSTKKFIVVGGEGKGIKVGMGVDNPNAALHVAGDLRVKNGARVEEIAEVLDDAQFPATSVPTSVAVAGGTNKLMLVACITSVNGAIQTLSSGPETNEKVLNFGKTIYFYNKIGNPAPFNATHFQAPTNGLYRFEFDFLVRDYDVPSGTLFLTLNTTSSTRVNLRAEELLSLTGSKVSKSYMSLAKTIYLRKSEFAKVQLTIPSNATIHFEDYFMPNRLTVTRLVETTIENYAIN